MKVKDKLHNTLMQTTLVWANHSYCKRNKVGCVIARDGRIIATGYNGTLPGSSNCCEKNNITKKTVMHAEQNAITFCAKNGLQTLNCDLYVTLAPCEICSKLIISSGIKRVFFIDFYRCKLGVKLLRKHKIKVVQLCLKAQ